MPLEAGMLCTIDEETFHLFTKNTWIGDSGASCYITNNETGLYNITVISNWYKAKILGKTLFFDISSLLTPNFAVRSIGFLN